MKINKIQPVGRQGYSLIEILVTVGIFAVLSVAVTQSLARSLVTSRKSESTIQVRENLDYVTSVMERDLRNAKELGSCTSTRIDYTKENGTPAYFECLEIGTDNGRVESEEGRITSDFVSIIVCQFSCYLSESTPPVANINISGQQAATPYSELSIISVSTSISPRLY